MAHEGSVTLGNGSRLSCFRQDPGAYLLNGCGSSSRYLFTSRPHRRRTRRTGAGV